MRDARSRASLAARRRTWSASRRTDLPRGRFSVPVTPDRPSLRSRARSPGKPGKRTFTRPWARCAQGNRTCRRKRDGSGYNASNDTASRRSKPTDTDSERTRLERARIHVTPSPHPRHQAASFPTLLHSTAPRRAAPRRDALVAVPADPRAHTNIRARGKSRNASTDRSVLHPPPRFPPRVCFAR
ncbi:hypothetical protein PUN28_006327 [Cardiocondyla obscurior]|uniref:Uncharacterized protein n=1 Tax=Cardiocondyla obscurior TaxID=286306 RepID=A0AAW2GA49_9HYME